ncbi:MAG: DUF2513 domain-containing protein [Planktomarina sp.]
MKRSLELQRTILSDIEACDDFDGLKWTPEGLYSHQGWPDGYLETGRTMSLDIEYNLLKLEEAGLVVVERQGEFWCSNLTHVGHDFLDLVRSDNVWAKTKSGASKVGGMTIGMTMELAKAYLKQEIAEKLGLEL